MGKQKSGEMMKKGADVDLLAVDQAAVAKFQIGDFANYKSSAGEIEGDITDIDYDRATVTIFNCLAPPGSRNLFDLPARLCLKIKARPISYYDAKYPRQPITRAVEGDNAMPEAQPVAKGELANQPGKPTRKLKREPAP